MQNVSFLLQLPFSTSIFSPALPFSFPSSFRSHIFSSKLRRRVTTLQGVGSSVSRRIRAMPSAGGGDGDVDGGFSFKLNESAFLSSLMPKTEINADRFIESNPEFDGRGAVIAIFDSGIDPAAAGLQVTSDGKPKILDILDCTGSGDVNISKVVKADANGCIIGASGASLVVNSSWKNPSGEWHVGYKLVYELFTNTLTSRLKRERKKDWDQKNQEEIAKAVKILHDFDQKHGKAEDTNLKRDREDLENQIDILKKQANCYDDKGPVIDAVVWHDGEVWRVAIDTQNLEDEPDSGKLANFVPLTNYKIERMFGVFSKLDACTFVVNVYDEGNILSIVTDCSPHGTHVAGIAAAFHPKEPLLNGVAPGAQLISCKIGDSRLGSMETGTGLTRAMIAAVEHKCDLINMSYGEPTLLPDYGRFVDLVNEAVNKHRIIFVSSAGNSGPALNTVGAPGGTSSSIIGVGAYVSPFMAAGAHCVVEAPTEGLEYTWSSRGPTADGDLGVCISAPGAAVAPVPTWTLQRRMLMNGTSMASPSACGGIALIISGMKAENISVSPYLVRKALENTAIPVGCLPEDKLSTGMGLMQVDKAYEYIRKSHNVPYVCYKVKINQSGKSSPTTRGIYLREASACRQRSEWTVQIEPQFHKDAKNLEVLVPFEECIELHSSEKTVLTVPDYLLLTHNGRSFNIVVDPSNLSDGLHYYELYGIDCKAPWRGPLFRIPITITKPTVVVNRPPLVSFRSMSFLPGYIERKFIEVPHGASWVEATMQTTGFDTTRKFFIDTVQILPLKRPMKWESVVTFSSPTSKCFCFPVVGGQTMELAIAQFWSSGIGSQESSLVDFEVKFHGISTNKDEILLDGSEAPIRIDAEALLASEKLMPAAILNKIRLPYRPSEAKLCTLPTNRDRLPSGKQILALTLTYKFKLEDGAEVKPIVPLFNNRIYDNKFESQFYVISDMNKRIYTMGDAYPDVAKLPKGEYNFQLHIRHEDMQYLEKMKQMVVFIERNFEEKDFIKLSFFSQPDGHMIGNGAFKSSTLVPGKKEAFYLGPPSKDKIPKNSQQGSILMGAISYGKLGFVNSKDKENPQKMPVHSQVSFIVPPTKPDENKGKGSSQACTKTVSERLEEEGLKSPFKYLGFEDGISHLEARFPAILFKQQLTACVEKIFGLIRDNLKKELSPLLGSCIQAPKTARVNAGKSSRSPGVPQQPTNSPWDNIIKFLDALMGQLRENHVPSFFIRKLITQVFSFINISLFNSLLLRRECCSFSNGEYVKSGLAELEKWIVNATEEFSGTSWHELKYIRQAVGFLVIHQKRKKSLEDIRQDLCPELTVRQIYRISTMYWDDKYGTQSVSNEVVAQMREILNKDNQNLTSNSFLLDDDLSIPFSTEDIDMALPPIEPSDIELPTILSEYSCLQFLVQPEK